MDLQQIAFSERLNAGTSKTNNEEFDKNGYFVVKNLYDPKELVTEVPKERGILNYYGDITQFTHVPEECQVQGSVSRYYYPPYKYAHSQIRLKLEKIIGKKLFNTYYYDRFYFSGQALTPHTDRNACEISLTFHVGTNIKTPWPIWIKTPDTYNNETKSEIISNGENRSVILQPGDGMIYKGCERPHWREPMPSDPKPEKVIKKQNFIEKIFKKTQVEEKETEEELIYYHQIFFHYVLADGVRSHCAGDMSN
jgi:hypothetical protein